MRKSDITVELNVGVEELSKCGTKTSRSVPGLSTPASAEGASKKRKRRLSVGILPADWAWSWLYLPIILAVPVNRAVSRVCFAASVSAEAIMTVGLMLRWARAKSTPGVATLVMAREAWE